MSDPDYPRRDEYSAVNTETTGNDASSLRDHAKTDLKRAGHEVSEQAHRVGDEVKREAANLGHQAKGMASEQKDLLASQMVGVSDALDKVAGELETENHAGAQYVRMIADHAGKLTSTINDNDVDDILAKAQDFGRKQPAAFLGAAALLGFAASRFVAASAKRQQGTVNPPTQSNPATAQASGNGNPSSGGNGGNYGV